VCTRPLAPMLPSLRRIIPSRAKTGPFVGKSGRSTASLKALPARRASWRTNRLTRPVSRLPSVATGVLHPPAPRSSLRRSSRSSDSNNHPIVPNGAYSKAALSRARAGLSGIAKARPPIRPGRGASSAALQIRKSRRVGPRQHGAGNAACGQRLVQAARKKSAGAGESAASRDTTVRGGGDPAARRPGHPVNATPPRPSPKPYATSADHPSSGAAASKVRSIPPSETDARARIATTTDPGPGCLSSHCANRRRVLRGPFRAAPARRPWPVRSTWSTTNRAEDDQNCTIVDAPTFGSTCSGAGDVSSSSSSPRSALAETPRTASRRPSAETDAMEIEPGRESPAGRAGLRAAPRLGVESAASPRMRC